MSVRLLLFYYHHNHHKHLSGIEHADRIQEARTSWTEVQEGVGKGSEKGSKVTMAQNPFSLNKTEEIGKGKKRLWVNNLALFDQ